MKNNYSKDIYSKIEEIREKKIKPEDLKSHINGNVPFIIRGLVKNWPLVQYGKTSNKAIRDYLLKFASKANFTVTVGGEENEGRIFYNDDMSMNIETKNAPLDFIFNKMDEAEKSDKQPLIYLGSIDIPLYFKDLRNENFLDLGQENCLESIWIGTKSLVAAHNDFPDNIACVVAGKRRFTLFPPEQFKNLYLGPVDNTPAGREVSMVDFTNPDFNKFPKFEEALNHALCATLEPGDAIFIPSMWWHQVEAFEKFNILVNYWWRKSPSYLGQPKDALINAIWSIRDLPFEQKQYWKDIFNHYIFENNDEITNHIPENKRGILDPITPLTSQKIVNYLLRSLNK